MSAEVDLANAEARSKAARAQLTATLVEIQTRLSPRSLLREAVDEVRETSVELLRQGLTKAREHPGPLIGIAATIAAYVARDWFIGGAKQADEPPPPPSLEPEPKAKPRRAARIAVEQPPKRKRP